MLRLLSIVANHVCTAFQGNHHLSFALGRLGGDNVMVVASGAVLISLLKPTVRKTKMRMLVVVSFHPPLLSRSKSNKEKQKPTRLQSDVLHVFSKHLLALFASKNHVHGLVQRVVFDFRVALWAIIPLFAARGSDSNLKKQNPSTNGTFPAIIQTLAYLSVQHVLAHGFGWSGNTEKK
jgi:hypothetical protein